MKTELRVLFFSPIAWMILIVFAFQSGLIYCNGLDDLLRSVDTGNRINQITFSLFGGYSGVCSVMLNDLYLYIPLLTMGLISRELSCGSIKLLYSSPVSNIQIILGKYLSMVVYALMLMVSLLILLILTGFIVKEAGIGHMLSCLLGVFLTTSAYAAIGLFMSSTTKYQVVAAVGTLGVLAALNFVDKVGRTIPFVSDLTYWLSISGRSRVFLGGMISSGDLLYFVLVIFMFLAFTFIKLQGERLKRSVWKIGVSYLAVFVFVILAGYASSQPFILCYYDATKTKANTLTEKSQKILADLDGGLTVTTYVNLFDKTWGQASLEARNADLKRFAQYRRFKPDIKFRYVYYYGRGDNTVYDGGVYRGLSPKERMEKVCEFFGYSPKYFIPEEEAFLMDDIAAENGRLVRVLTQDDGRKSYLRTYNDIYVHPFESEIAVALKMLSDKYPLVGFVSGHEERDCNDGGEKGYLSFAASRAARNALINQGFRIEKLSLAQPVPPEVDVLVIADLRSAMTPEEYTNYEQFVDRGGNLVILGEPKRQEFINPMLDKLGLRLSDGILVSPSNEYLDDVVAATVAGGAQKVSPALGDMMQRGYTVVTPSAGAVEVVDSAKGFEITEILVTKPQGSWVENTTTDFLNEKSALNTEKGEVERSHPVMQYLTRDRPGQPQQRIFVGGDADCFSNKEFSTNRVGLNNSAFTLVGEMFRCLAYDQYPLQIPRRAAIDNELYLSSDSSVWVKILFLGIIPVILLIWGCIFLVRRKRG